MRITFWRMTKAPIVVKDDKLRYIFVRE